MKQITPEEAIARLDSMQAQIIHGKNTFGECADVIRRLQTRIKILESSEKEREPGYRDQEGLGHQ